MMSVSNGSTQAEAATAHLCSRDADGDGVGGYPSDPQRAAPRKKCFAASFEDRDQTEEELSDSETSYQ